MVTRPKYPGDAGRPITKPLDPTQDAGFRGGYLGNARYDNGVEYMVAALLELGWRDGGHDVEGGARHFAEQLVERYPGMSNDEYTLAPQIIDRLLSSIADPHDVDTAGLVIDMLDLFWRSM